MRHDRYAWHPKNFLDDVGFREQNVSRKSSPDSPGRWKRSFISFSFLSAYMLGKTTGLSSEPARWSCDYCQQMSDFDSCQFIIIRMAYKVLISPRCDIWHQLTWSVCTVGVRYVITKFSRMDSLPNFLTHGAPQARASLRRRRECQNCIHTYSVSNYWYFAGL